MDKASWVIIVILVFISPATALGFTDDVGTRLTLKGIEGFQVVIGGGPAGENRYESPDSYLQSVIENKLLMAGIQVLDASECIKAPGSPWLYFTLNLDGGEPTHFKINIFVCQKAYLARNRANAYVATWSNSYTGWVTHIGEIDFHIDDAIDRFIKAWQSANQNYLLK